MLLKSLEQQNEALTNDWASKQTMQALAREQAIYMYM